MRKLFKSIETHIQRLPLYGKSEFPRVFGRYSLPRKTLVFHTEICELCELRILKICIFYRFRELFKSNQTWCVRSPVSIETVSERISGV